VSFWAYLLRCSDGSYYAGHSDDLEQRIAQHQAGEVPGYTHDRRPLEMVWSEAFGTREEALAAELRIKGWSRAKKEALLRGDWSQISALAIPPAEREGRALRLRSGRTEVDAMDPTSVRAERSRSTATHPTSPPVIVLVRPQLGQNIGKAARAMLNFGLTEMRLVSPRDGWPNPDAGPAASGADSLLEQAQVFDTVAEAIADCAHVYATTVRKRGVTKPVVTPAEAADAIWAAPGRSAILFGPERSGLETDDVAVARTILTVPINPEFGSLNLAQAVILVAYEWSKGQRLAQPPAVDIDPPAPQAELDGMIDQLDGMLETAGFFFPPDRTPATKRTLRTMLTKPGWNSQEVRTLRGVLSALANPRQR
jgi:tRNA/rRNA methyltransferase